MSVPAEPRNDSSVLVVGATTEARAVYRYLTRERLRATHLETAAEASRLIADEPGGVLLVDIDDAHGEAVELCRSVKRNSATRLMPIVLLSDDRQRDHRLAGIETGAEAVLAKPFDPEELLVRVRAFRG